MSIPIYQVDAFTSQPFKGNPAAVCLLQTSQSDRWMQAVALEMNLSETAFLLPENDGYRLRWFTPTVEVELCGHATLASSHILWETGQLQPRQTARFFTLSGLLTANRRDAWIEMDFPATPPQPCEAPSGLLESLSVIPRYVGRNNFDYLVEVADEASVQAVTPDFGRLATIPARGVIVTSRCADPDYDFVSRFFAPAAGVNEDPVTGSAHCSLAPYWGGILGKSGMIARQISARAGVIRVKLAGDRVQLGGQAVTVMRAELLA